MKDLKNKPGDNVQILDYDVVVIGAGPAGATAATMLAESGRKVAVLEKERFPRYRIGESLIPHCYFTLERLGVLDKIRASGFTKKYSVQFASTSGRVSQPFYFFQHADHPSSTTWQVPRAEFDRILIENAVEKGAELFVQTRARDLLREKGVVSGVATQNERGEVLHFRAPMTIDASGRESFAVVRNKWRVPDEMLQKVAIWTYYRGAMRDTGYDAGATTVAYIPEKGWFWYIPLPDDLVSVGVVADKSYLYADTRDPESIFYCEVEKNPWIAAHLEPGTRERGFQVTGDYSYRAKYCAEDGLLLTGDAFAFLDPVFSSGILFALIGGETAACAVEGALRKGDTSAAQFKEYAEMMCSGMESMRKVVYAFYDKQFSFRDLFEKDASLRPDLTDILIGNLSKDFSRLFDTMASIADVPEPMSHGRPLEKHAVDAQS